MGEKAWSDSVWLAAKAERLALVLVLRPAGVSVCILCLVGDLLVHSLNTEKLGASRIEKSSGMEIGGDCDLAERMLLAETK